MLSSDSPESVEELEYRLLDQTLEHGWVFDLHHLFAALPGSGLFLITPGAARLPHYSLTLVHPP